MGSVSICPLVRRLDSVGDISNNEVYLFYLFFIASCLLMIKKIMSPKIQNMPIRSVKSPNRINLIFRQQPTQRIEMRKNCNPFNIDDKKYCYD